MKVIQARNVNDAFRQGVHLLSGDRPLERASRVGTVLEWPTPVTTVYARPWERILWNKARGANPFFHFFESMWMLAGREDVEFPAMLLPRMREYSDDGRRMQGAYGYRWRRWFKYDQLAYIVAELDASPDSRRAVLTMWDPLDLKDRPDSKDIPCNTHIYFKVYEGVLRMTVCNRSNDMLWGAYGANAVHMAFLQEYLANKLGLTMGPYTQVSDSFHVYTGGPGGDVWDRVCAAYQDPDEDLYATAPRSGESLLVSEPMGAHTPDWDADCYRFFSLIDAGVLPSESDFDTRWWGRVCAPLWKAHFLRDESMLFDCAAPDWRVAGFRWFHARKEKTK